MITTRWIDRDDPLYLGERRLRFEVLRRPLGMAPGSEENPNETRCAHCVAIENGEVVGCVLALADRVDGREDKTRVKLLQMAVAPTHMGRGVGAMLVRELERKVALEGAIEVHMHARMSASGFYEKLGYAAIGEVFSEVGLPHIKMQRRLGAPADY